MQLGYVCCFNAIFKMDPQWRALIIDKLNAKIDFSVDNSKGCHFWDKSLYCHQVKGGPKYGRLKITMPNGRQRLFLAHRLMYMVQNNVAEISPNLHVSHRCHESLCINSEHLSLEPPCINSERDTCKHKVPPSCNHHSGYQDCIL